MGIRSGYGNENENEKRKMGKWENGTVFSD